MFKKQLYIVSLKEIFEYAPQVITARSEKQAIKTYLRFYHKGMMGKRWSPALQLQSSSVSEKPSYSKLYIPPLLRDEKGDVKPLQSD